MTESEWLACSDPQKMLEWLRHAGTASDRKLRLFAVACCRRIWPLLMDEQSRRAVEAAELYAEGQMPRTQLESVWDAAGVGSAGHAVDGAAADDALWGAEWAARNAAEVTRDARLSEQLREELGKGAVVSEGWPAFKAWMDRREALHSGERAAQAALLRCLFGNPSRPSAPPDPAWLTVEAVTLARAIYDKRSFDRIPEVGDALQEAGCCDPDILGHCRGPGPHVRGCWVVDLILGKS
jgi:hypothetical protein